MESIKTKLIIKSLLGAVLSMLISTILLAINVSNGEIITSGSWVLAQFIGSALMGAICMGSSVVYEVERWGLVKVTLIHYSIALIAFAVTSVFLNWFTGIRLLIAVGVYTGAYALVWLLEFILWKNEIKKMNRELKAMAGKQEGGSL